MTTISDKDRAEVRAMFEAAFGPNDAALSDSSVRRWLAVRDHVLASYTPDSASGQARVLAWDDIAKHPFFADCYPTDGTLVEAMLAKLDATHAHTCKPVWRPTTRDEIQAGWEVRARYSSGTEARWGRLVRLLDRASHRLELADARAACRREGHWWDSERPAGALHVHDFCWRCEARR